MIAWVALIIQCVFGVGVAYAGVTGGNVSYDDGYMVHTFTNSGTLVISDGSLVCDVLVVAGGGGGSFPGAGGGGGGVIYTSTYAVAAGSYAVTVGDGGAGDATWGGGCRRAGRELFSWRDADSGRWRIRWIIQ